MNLDNAYDLICEKYNTSKERLLNILNDNFVYNNEPITQSVISNKDSLNNHDLANDVPNDPTNDAINDIILPYCNVINNDCCKAIVFNHGLYTQCTNKTKTDVCCSCKKLKYGRIEERLDVEKNKFVAKTGKKEVPYEKFIKKMNYNIDDVKNALKKNNLTFEFNEKYKKQVKNTGEKRGRGRPRKVLESNEVEIEVERVLINGCEYLRTIEGVILDSKTYEVLDIKE